MENSVLDNEELVIDTPRNFSNYWVRLGANILDGLFLIPVMAIMMYNMYVLKNMPLAFLVLLLITIYKPLLEYYYGATWGKMVLNIKVVNEQNSLINFSQALIRSFPGLIGALIGLYVTYITYTNDGFLEADGFFATGQWQQENSNGILDYLSMIILILSSLFILWESKKQAFHDKLANTYVVKTLDI